MPYLSSFLSYDPALNPTKATIAEHTKRRGLFGRRCVCGKRWRDFGCEARIPEFIAYLQDSTAADRAADLQYHRNLFTTFEAEIIEANDARSHELRAKAAEERAEREFWAAWEAAGWQEPYPEPAKPVFWFGPSQTGVHEVIREPVAAVPRQRAPEAPLTVGDPIDLGALIS